LPAICLPYRPILRGIARSPPSRLGPRLAGADHHHAPAFQKWNSEHPAMVPHTPRRPALRHRGTAGFSFDGCRSNTLALLFFAWAYVLCALVCERQAVATEYAPLPPEKGQRGGGGWHNHASGYRGNVKFRVAVSQAGVDHQDEGNKKIGEEAGGSPPSSAYAAQPPARFAARYDLQQAQPTWRSPWC
jgi:hypothetical protein